ncbi:MAG: GatB/YqeY domain-containing protein [Chloroflexi bacterium]|nr:MAG: GatB/YqeY domain-containing protein [Chloroflexota bacterium]
METREKLELALKDAMRSKDEMRKQNVRMVMSAIKLNEVEKGARLDEAGVIAILQKELKSRQEALQDAQKANRPDLAERSKAEIAFLETFLPQQLTEAELAGLAQETITEVGATGPADMGRVMKAIMPKVQGRATGDQVSQAVRKALQK